MMKIIEGSILWKGKERRGENQDKESDEMKGQRPSLKRLSGTGRPWKGPIHDKP